MCAGRSVTAAVTVGLAVATLSTPACSTPREPVTDTTFTTTEVPGPPATTVEQLCQQQSWPRPIPDVTGRLLHQTVKIGALGCWTDVHAVTPDGRAPGNGDYRIAAVTPPAGTPALRDDAVTVEVVEVDSAAPPAFHPCTWLTVDEAADILGAPAEAIPHGDRLGSVDIECAYRTAAGGNGMTSELRLPDAFPVDAAAQFALTTATGSATVVDGLGLRAQCVSEPTTTPPSTTLLVLLSGARIYRATGWYALSCDQLSVAAQTAIDRIGA